MYRAQPGFETYRVEAGARWSQVIRALDPLGFSPAVMQSNHDFGAAATLSVSIPRSTVEAARGMGMTHVQVLWWIELRLALPVILPGVRTALVISIGAATLAAYIGAGGLGQLIFQGIAMVDTPLLSGGAIPVALRAQGPTVTVGSNVAEEQICAASGRWPR